MAEWLALSRLLQDAPAARCVSSAGPIQTFAHLRRQALAWRETFARRPGRWALYFEDTGSFIAALFGAWHAGVEVWLCGDALPATLEAMQAHVVGFAGDVPADLQTATPAPASEAAAEAAVWEALDETATRLVVFTSGSTGTPAAIGKSLAQLARETEALEQCFGHALGTACVHGTVSHQHIYGLLFRALWPLAAGRPIAARSFFHEDVLQALAHSPASLLVTTPAHLKRLPENLPWAQVNTRLRAVFSSGGALPESAAQDAARLLGCAPWEIYGSSETGGIAWRSWQAHGPGEWRALPGVHWRINDERLELRSPHLPDDNWWRSEDRVQAMGEGFRLLGRADRIVKIEERRVSLDALEQALLRQPEVAEARVLVLPGARTQLAAVIVPDSAAASLLAEHGKRAFAQRLSNALADAQDAVTRPRRWRFVDALPCNAQGKVPEAALRALFDAEPVRRACPQPQWEEIGPDKARARVLADADLLVFDGHFPGVPILPGVAQLDWALRMAREVFPLPPKTLRVEGLKFQNIVRPGTWLELQLHWHADRQMLDFSWHSTAGLHARGRIFMDAAA